MPTIFKNGVVREMTAAEIAADEAAQAQIADAADDRKASASRLIRNKKLADSDWTQAADSPLTTSQKSAWATYRAELRNRPTADDNWPDSEAVTWPEEPTG